ncbi:MAG: HAD hydrolase-like protein, partial [Actinobacteria bacterium]|nr:HAD hydrolase-like protein [Actinomycetota bacterium]
MPPRTPRPERDRPKALLFDMDGTLAETEEVHCRAFNAAFAERGL